MRNLMMTQYAAIALESCGKENETPETDTRCVILA